MSLPVRLQWNAASPAVAVESVHISASVSEPWMVVADVLTEESSLSFADVMGETAALVLDEEPWIRRIEGLLVGVEQMTCEPEGLSGYRITLCPPAWLASQNREHRIFQHVAVDAVAEALLADYRQPVAKKLSAPLAEREYITQYGESDLAFFQRILAEEGLAFIFDLESGELVLTDDTRAELGPAIAIPYQRAFNRARDVPHAHHVSRAARVAPGKLSRTDFDAEKPRLALAAAADTPEGLFGIEEKLEVHAHDPGQFVSPDAGKRIASFEMQAIRARARSLQVGLSSLAFPGSELTIRDAPIGDAGGALLLTSVRAHLRRGNDGNAAWDVMTVAQPKNASFRSARIAKPTIPGTHTALVVGASGQEIDVDEQGRVVVAFAWDRRRISEGAPTRRVRVSQAWAGPGYGLVTLPRVGDEVVVTYLDGDPDEPLIVGRVHNGTAPSPLKLPDEKTKSIWRTKSTGGGDGGNHLLFEDQAGSELVEIFGQRDLKVHAQRDCDIAFGNNARQSVGANHDVSVKGDQSISVSGTQGTKVGGAMLAQSASYSLVSGPIGLQGTTISLNADAAIAAQAPKVSVAGEAAVGIFAPEVIASATGSATVSGPVAVLEAAAVAGVKGAIVTVQGLTVIVSGAATIDIGAGAAVTVSAPTVNVAGTGTTNVGGGGTTNVSGGTVNIKGGTVAIN